MMGSEAPKLSGPILAHISTLRDIAHDPVGSYDRTVLLSYYSAAIIQETYFRPALDDFSTWVPTNHESEVINAVCHDLYPADSLYSIFYRNGGLNSIVGLVKVLKKSERINTAMDAIKGTAGEAWLAWSISTLYKQIQNQWVNDFELKTPREPLLYVGKHPRISTTVHHPDDRYRYPERERLPPPGLDLQRDKKGNDGKDDPQNLFAQQLHDKDANERNASAFPDLNKQSNKRRKLDQNDSTRESHTSSVPQSSTTLPCLNLEQDPYKPQPSPPTAICPGFTGSQQTSTADSPPQQLGHHIQERHRSGRSNQSNSLSKSNPAPLNTPTVRLLTTKSQNISAHLSGNREVRSPHFGQTHQFPPSPTLTAISSQSRSDRSSSTAPLSNVIAACKELDPECNVSEGSFSDCHEYSLNHLSAGMSSSFIGVYAPPRPEQSPSSTLPIDTLAAVAVDRIGLEDTLDNQHDLERTPIFDRDGWDAMFGIDDPWFGGAFEEFV